MTKNFELRKEDWKDGKNIHTGTELDKDGYDIYGYNKDKFNRAGINLYTGTIWDRNDFNQAGINRYTGTKYNSNGYDKDGYDAEGYNAFGYDRTGFNRRGFDKEGYNRAGFNVIGLNRQGCDEQGYSWVTHYKEQKNKKLQELGTILFENEPEEQRTDKIKQGLLDNSIDLRKVNNIGKILESATEEERKVILKRIIDSISSHQITTLEYAKIFGKKNISPRAIPVIVADIDSIVSEATADPVLASSVTNETISERERLLRFAESYTNKNEKIGFKKSPSDSTHTWLKVSQVEREIAESFVISQGEIPCSFTMKKALRMLAEGELLVKQPSARLMKQRKLEELMKTDQKLDGVLSKAEKFLTLRSPDAKFFPNQK